MPMTYIKSFAAALDVCATPPECPVCGKEVYLRDLAAGDAFVANGHRIHEYCPSEIAGLLEGESHEPKRIN